MMNPYNGIESYTPSNNPSNIFLFENPYNGIERSLYALSSMLERGLRNPYNGIERILLTAALEAVLTEQNPYNGIERRVKNCVENGSSLRGIHTMELKGCPAPPDPDTLYCLYESIQWN